MRNWTRYPGEPQEIAILLFPRFSNHCLANAVEPLRAANEIIGWDFYRWRFVTLEGEAVESSSGLPVMPNSRLRDHGGGDHLFVLSSYDAKTLATTKALRALRAASKRFTTIVGMDTGAWLMAAAGLLDGGRATIHWDELIAFSEEFAQVDAVSDRFVVTPGRMTCGGAMTAFDLVLELVRRTHGEAVQLEVSSYFIHRPFDGSLGAVGRRGLSPMVEEAISIMTESLESPPSIGRIAQSLGTTQRTLGRLFQAELGAPPKRVEQRLRLATARRLAQESRHSIAEIAVRCGYTSAVSMTRAFREHYGKPPSRFRGRPGE